jgi:hypothetical protein
MSRARPMLSPEILALLDCERNLSSLPATVRGRALVRARAALVAGVAGIDRRAAPAPAALARWAAAAAVVCILSIGLGAAAYEVRARLARGPGGRPTALAVEAAASVEKVATPPRAPLASAPTARLPAAAARVDTATPSHVSAARAELRLLRQARAAVVREDYADALPPIFQHARRFEGGRLTEEREALRIKALAGLGRTAEARLAASAFCARFPRSVLLQAVSELSTSEP